MNPNNINDIKEYLAYDSSTTIDEEALGIAIKLAERHNESNITWITDYVLSRTSSVTLEKVEPIQQGVQLIKLLIENIGNKNPLEFFRTHKYLLIKIFKNLNFSIATIIKLLEKFNIYKNLNDPKLFWVGDYITSLLSSAEQETDLYPENTFRESSRIIQELIGILEYQGSYREFLQTHKDLLIIIFKNQNLKIHNIASLPYQEDPCRILDNFREYLFHRVVFIDPATQTVSQENWEFLIKFLKPTKVNIMFGDIFDQGTANQEDQYASTSTTIAQYDNKILFERYIYQSTFCEGVNIYIDYYIMTDEIDNE